MAFCGHFYSFAHSSSPLCGHLQLLVLRQLAELPSQVSNKGTSSVSAKEAFISSRLPVVSPDVLMSYIVSSAVQRAIIYAFRFVVQSSWVPTNNVFFFEQQKTNCYPLNNFATASSMMAYSAGGGDCLAARPTSSLEKNNAWLLFLLWKRSGSNSE